MKSMREGDNVGKRGNGEREKGEQFDRGGINTNSSRLRLAGKNPFWSKKPPCHFGKAEGRDDRPSPTKKRRVR